MQIPFVGATYNGRSSNVDASRSINFYPELSSTPDSNTVVALIGTPGTKEFFSWDSGQARLLYNFAGRCFVVIADSIYELFTDGTKSVALAVFPESTGFISAADNGLESNGIGGNQLIMVTNNKGYIFNVVTNVLTQITDVDFPTTPKFVEYADGYFIVTDGTMIVRCSELYDGLMWSGLAFAGAITSPDNVQNVIYSSQQLYVFKEMAVEVWYDSGTPTSQGSPFIRLQGTSIEFGTPAPRSVVRGSNTVFFLANARNSDFSEFIGVARLNGYTPELVSNQAINYRISQLTTLSDAQAYCYSDEGHIFYVLTFPTDDVTLVYDATTNMWHERSTSDNFDGLIHRHLSELYTYFGGKHLVTDYRAPKIMSMSSEYYDDDGQAIVSTRVAQTISDKGDNSSLFIHKLVVDVEGGVGDSSVTPIDPYFAWFAGGSHLADGLGYAGGFSVVLSPSGDPKAWLSWSNDGGHTWSNKYEASMGKMGEYKTRLSWRRLGKARNRVFKLEMPSANKKIIVNAFIDDGVSK